MISNLSNTDNSKTEDAPDLQSTTQRRVAWEHKGGVESQPKWYLLQIDFVWAGVVLAAACYPIVVTGFAMVFWTFANGFGGWSWETLVMMFIFLMISSVVGLIYGILMSIPAWFLTELLRWALKGIISERAVSGVYGGMTGFLCVSGGGLFVTEMPPLRDWEVWLSLVLASLLAVVMGYVGAILAGYRKRNDGFSFFEPIFSFEQQITIGYLMKLTFIVAALSVVLKVAGPVGINVGIAWLVYFLVQTLLLVGDHWITRGLSQRHLCNDK